MRNLLQRSLERKWKQGGLPVWPTLVLVGPWRRFWRS